MVVLYPQWSKPRTVGRSWCPQWYTVYLRQWYGHGIYSALYLGQWDGHGTHSGLYLGQWDGHGIHSGHDGGVHEVDGIGVEEDGSTAHGHADNHRPERVLET